MTTMPTCTHRCTFVSLCIAPHFCPFINWKAIVGCPHIVLLHCKTPCEYFITFVAVSRLKNGGLCIKTPLSPPALFGKVFWLCRPQTCQIWYRKLFLTSRTLKSPSTPKNVFWLLLPFRSLSFTVQDDVCAEYVHLKAVFTFMCWRAKLSVQDVYVRVWFCDIRSVMQMFSFFLAPLVLMQLPPFTNYCLYCLKKQGGVSNFIFFLWFDKSISLSFMSKETKLSNVWLDRHKTNCSYT